MKRRSKKTQHVGTITSAELLAAPRGHQDHMTGTGAHRDRKRDRKLQRRQDKKLCRDY